MVFTLYSTIYLITAIAAFILGFLAIQRKAVVAAWELFLLALSVGIDTYFCFYESMATTQAAKVLWSSVASIGGSVTPVFYFLFIVRFTELIKFKHLRFGWTLFIFPVITIIIAFTNSLHHLMWSGFSSINPTTNLMVFEHGFWFWVGYTLYSYVILAIATYFIIRFIVRNRKKRAYRRQGILIVIGGTLPWLTSMIYILDISPIKGLDIAPISTLLGGVIFTNAILKNSFMNLMPIARETLVETLPLGILALDEQNRIQDINIYARRFLKISEKDILGIELKFAMAEDEFLFNMLLSRKKSIELSRSIDNEIHYFTISKQPIRSIPGSRLITIQEITEQINRQHELSDAKFKAEESDRLKSAFLANMSHEIRTPMNGILGFVSLLKRNDITTEERGQYLDIVRKNCYRLLNTLNDIIDLSKIESGQMDVNESVMDLNEVVQSMNELFGQEAQMKGLEFRCHSSLVESHSMVITDKNKIYSIASNLIKNGIKYTNQGYVHFECSLKNQIFTLCVRDSGIGITESKQVKIFDRFVQVNDSTSREYEGSGLGLAITKAYVDMLGGNICLESKEGQGSHFSVEIPMKLMH